MVGEDDAFDDRDDPRPDDRSTPPPRGTLAVSDTQTYVGDEVTILGHDLPPNQDFRLIWHSMDGYWGVVDGTEITGPLYRSRTDHLTTVTTDDAGQFDEAFVVPEDVGGSHVIELDHPTEGVLAQTELAVTPWFEIDRQRAPLGETFRITGYGLGPNPLTSNYQVTWDNCTVGFMTGVNNDGTATAEIRAVGPLGPHVLQVWRNHQGVPFLQNNTQSPFGPVAGWRRSVWTVDVTEPEMTPETAWVGETAAETPVPAHYPDLDVNTDADITISPTSGSPGTQTVVSGTNFPPETTVDLIWHRHQGHRVRGIPFTPEPEPDVLPMVTTDDAGSFQVEAAIPPDIGSTRPITAEVDGRSIAVTGFVVQPDVLDISPTKGPVGTEIEIELTGVGWTTYDNALFFVYDNKPLGYACGVDEGDATGITRVTLHAAGLPGYHFIDIYPTIFETREAEPNFEIKPHLSYRDNHPMRPLPAMHCTFEVTDGAVRRE